MSDGQKDEQTPKRKWTVTVESLRPRCDPGLVLPYDSKIVEVLKLNNEILRKGILKWTPIGIASHIDFVLKTEEAYNYFISLDGKLVCELLRVPKKENEDVQDKSTIKPPMLKVYEVHNDIAGGDYDYNYPLRVYPKHIEISKGEYIKVRKDYSELVENEYKNCFRVTSKSGGIVPADVRAFMESKGARVFRTKFPLDYKQNYPYKYSSHCYVQIFETDEGVIENLLGKGRSENDPYTVEQFHLYYTVLTLSKVKNDVDGDKLVESIINDVGEVLSENEKRFLRCNKPENITRPSGTSAKSSSASSTKASDFKVRCFSRDMADKILMYYTNPNNNRPDFATEQFSIQEKSRDDKKRNPDDRLFVTRNRDFCYYINIMKEGRPFNSINNNSNNTNNNSSNGMTEADVEKNIEGFGLGISKVIHDYKCSNDDKVDVDKAVDERAGDTLFILEETGATVKDIDGLKQLIFDSLGIFIDEKLEEEIRKEVEAVSGSGNVELSEFIHYLRERFSCIPSDLRALDVYSRLMRGSLKNYKRDENLYVVRHEKMHTSKRKVLELELRLRTLLTSQAIDDATNRLNELNLHQIVRNDFSIDEAKFKELCESRQYKLRDSVKE